MGVESIGEALNLGWRVTALCAALALLAAPAAAATLDQNAIVAQIAQSISTSETAVGCQLRTSDWRKSVMLGWYATARLALMSAHPDASDDRLSVEAAKIIQAAKVQAAMDAQFAAPTQAQCRTLNASHDMQEMDAAAKIGLMFGAVNEE